MVAAVNLTRHVNALATLPGLLADMKRSAAEIAAIRQCPAHSPPGGGLASDRLEGPSLIRLFSHARSLQTMPGAYSKHTLLTHEKDNLLEIEIDELAGGGRTDYAAPAPSSAVGSMRYPRCRSNSRYCSETPASW